VALAVSLEPCARATHQSPLNLKVSARAEHRFPSLLNTIIFEALRS
jgi:hypothetical protein